MFHRVLAPFLILGLLLLGLILAFNSGWNARFPDLWPFLIVLGLGLSFSLRYRADTGVGVLGRLCAILAGVGMVVDTAIRWMR